MTPSEKLENASKLVELADAIESKGGQTTIGFKGRPIIQATGADRSRPPAALLPQEMFDEINETIARKVRVVAQRMIDEAERELKIPPTADRGLGHSVVEITG